MREAVEEAIDCIGGAIAFRIAERSGTPAPARRGSSEGSD